MDLKERLIELIESEGLNPNKFYSKSGLGNGFLDKVGNKLKKPSIEKIMKSFPLWNIDYLQTGEGNKYIDKNKVEEKKLLQDEIVKDNLNLIPEVEFRFLPDTINLLKNENGIKRFWHLPDCKDCDGITQIWGNSMLPTYPSGCWVALKKIGFSVNHPNGIPFGQVFGILLKDEITNNLCGHIKILRRHKDPELAKKYWIARSINQQEFDDFNIEIRSVQNLWIVKQHIISEVIL